MRVVIALLIALVSFVLGLFLILKPSAAIELQRRFYELINWRITPVSMPKEIRNTKLMGAFLLIMVALLLLCLLFC